jgi:hypothetical protein
VAGNITSNGTMDGKPAKIIYDPDRRQTTIYWNGRGRSDGSFHDHATIQDSSPNEFHFMRLNGRVVVNQSCNPDPQAKYSRFQRDLQNSGGWVGVFRDSLYKALRFSGIGGNKKRRRW